MKKHVGKLVSLVLAIAMVLTMCIGVTAMADGETTTPSTYKLTINNTTVGHEYSVYQIYTGTISGTSPNYVLSDVKYGANYSGKTAGDSVPESELTALKGMTGDAAAAGFTTSGDPVKTVQSKAGSTEIDGLVPGYYLVKETSASTIVRRIKRSPIRHFIRGCLAASVKRRRTLYEVVPAFYSLEKSLRQFI